MNMALGHRMRKHPCDHTQSQDGLRSPGIPHKIVSDKMIAECPSDIGEGSAEESGHLHPTLDSERAFHGLPQRGERIEFRALKFETPSHCGARFSGLKDSKNT